MCYDYKRLMSEIDALRNDYDFIEISSVGKSVMGRDIPLIKIGSGKKKIMLGGAYHGLEYLTAAFLMKFSCEYLNHYVNNEDFFSKNPKELFEKVTLTIIPMVNIDGVDIAIHGLDITNPFHRRLISLVGIHSFNSVWQANANGVDLNHNYDAKWSMVAERPSPTKYGGAYPESEPETKAVTQLMLKENFDMVLAFHSQGREIYYDFNGAAGRRSRAIAEKMAQESGYAVCVPQGTAAFGGCKDWFIKEFGKDGFTVEIGLGKNPLPMSMLSDIYDENTKIILTAMEEV